MMRRTLANMASFYTEQQSVDVKEGLAKCVESGLFVGVAPYGYRNVRRDGRSIVEVAPAERTLVQRIFHLYAYHGHTLDSLADKLEEEGAIYTDGKPRFGRSMLHRILRAKTREHQEETIERRQQLQRQLGSVRQQQDRLLNLRLNEEIESDTFHAKQTELRDREANLDLQLEAVNRGRHENAEIAVKAFELSQNLTEK